MYDTVVKWFTKARPLARPIRFIFVVYLLVRPEFILLRASISVLDNRFLYYGRPFLYWTIDFFTTGVHFCAGQSISLLRTSICALDNRFLYYGRPLLYWTIDFFTLITIECYCKQTWQLHDLQSQNLYSSTK